ncbi:Hsp70 ATPase ssc1 [Aspergillus nanangensis]|uniref:Hsp70 ATPase ssc1 n=1 Tax=Aspergillus nanangensis TaxID=2582783 RepID=A0AAD4GQU3_ASPNN|nr:Hsp70 ATPase ssc1 [Aspergillus nanangensis]
MAGGFLPYHEPSIVQILILISFFLFLSLAEWVSAKIIRAGLIGQIAVGIIYGVPLADILEHNWQETFLALGYIGLILIIFEGGLGARLDLLKQNFVPSLLGAATGVVLPIEAVETFIIGSALCSTSLGTTFAVISSASKTVDLAQTRVGSILVSAAVIDDVVGLVFSSIIGDLGELSHQNHVNLGWIIGRPIVASVAMAILTPLLTKYIFAPLFRRFIEFHFARYDHISNIILMVLVLCAFISIAAYAGTSVLFGSFLAGSFLTYIPSKRPESPFVVMSREQGEREEDKSPTFVHTFEAYLMGVQAYLMEPLFFASVGFAIPFVGLWTGKRIWRGVLYTLLMAVAKKKRRRQEEAKEPEPQTGSATAERRSDETLKPSATWQSALLLGSAMVARGEIGLLIIEIGYNQTDYLSEEGFITGVWAILLNTIIGPVVVGVLVSQYGHLIGESDWGLQREEDVEQRGDSHRH